MKIELGGGSDKNFFENFDFLFGTAKFLFVFLVYLLMLLLLLLLVPDPMVSPLL